jgi:hypothetical protein
MDEVSECERSLDVIAELIDRRERQSVTGEMTPAEERAIFELTLRLSIACGVSIAREEARLRDKGHDI